MEGSDDNRKPQKYYHTRQRTFLTITTTGPEVLESLQITCITPATIKYLNWRLSQLHYVWTGAMGALLHHKYPGQHSVSHTRHCLLNEKSRLFTANSIWISCSLHGVEVGYITAQPWKAVRVPLDTCIVADEDHAMGTKSEKYYWVHKAFQCIREAWFFRDF